ncbi:MAG: YbaN family protein [Bacteroidetes bacterium]|nr:YbaN family protein [Bacteroidota bacterium]
MIKHILILLGSIFLGLGFIGIIVPGLPTTPFLLLAAGCYVRSSDRLYSWLLDNRLFGKYIHNFRETGSIPLRGKIISLIVMWIMIGLSIYIFIKIISVKIIIAILGVIGTLVILSIPASRK